MKTFSIEPRESERTQTITCPLCDSAIFSSLWNCDSFTYVKCSNCGLILQNPQPLFGDLATRYEEDYFSYEKANENSFFSLMSMALGDMSFQDIEEACKKVGPFLDIGCATGMLIQSLKQRGWRVQGVEICRPAAEYGIAQRGVSIHIGTVESAVFERGLFSVVHCSHLIEHLGAPNTFFKDLRRILHDNGYLILTTPNVSSLQSFLFGAKWRSAIADHLILYSKKTLKRMLEKHGFRIVKIKTWGGLGLGYRPKILKPFLDKLAKLLGFGDVMVLRVQKTPYDPPSGLSGGSIIGSVHKAI